MLGVYLIATLPYLSKAPHVIWDEGEIAAPAYKLAKQRVFGSDFYYGYSGHERANYYIPPLVPLAQALSFKLMGFGVAQARAVSVFFGLGILWLCFVWGQALGTSRTGLLAGCFLCLMSVSMLPHSSGMPFLDAARTGRYDATAVFWLLAACVCFVKAEARQLKFGYLAAGICGGLSCLSHFYGVLGPFLLVLFLFWRTGRQFWKRAEPWLVVLGWTLAMTPWLIYVLQDPESYAGQSLKWRAMGRLEFFDFDFYWQNLVAEKSRYASLLAGADGYRLFPRVGFWFLVVGVVVANIRFLKGGHADKKPARFLVFAGLPLCALFLALTTKFKVPGYTLLLMPFACLQLALISDRVWESLTSRTVWARLAASGLLLAVFTEGGMGLSRYLAHADRITAYDAVCAQITRELPPHARVLTSGEFFFGLADYQPRSVYLPFFMAHPAYNPGRPVSMDQAIAEIGPDFILEDPIFRNPHLGPPGTESLEPEFRSYLARHCSRVLFSTETGAYGRLVLYECKD